MKYSFSPDKHLEPTKSQSFFETRLVRLLTHNEETLEDVVRQVKYPLRGWLSSQIFLGVYVFFVILI